MFPHIGMGDVEDRGSLMSLSDFNLPIFSIGVKKDEDDKLVFKTDHSKYNTQVTSITSSNNTIIPADFSWGALFLSKMDPGSQQLSAHQPSSENKPHSRLHPNSQILNGLSLMQNDIHII